MCLTDMSTASRKSRFIELVVGKAILALSFLSAILFAVPTRPQTLKAAGETGAKTHFDRAKRMLQSDDFRGARAELELALKANPNFGDAYWMLGTVEYQLGDTTMAVSHLRRAVALLPDSFDAH